MQDVTIKKMYAESYPPGLLEIPDVPVLLNVAGAPLPKDGKYLAVVGSRTHTRYGGDACDKLIRGLAGSGIIIVSGLALGIDSVAHRSAIKAGLRTVAFPGSGLGEEALYPSTNLALAKEILASGGTLVSEYASNHKSEQWMFPRRNRLMSGIAQAVLVIEAASKSGTLITARLALDYNREVLAVPGPINSSTSFGTNLLIRQGATPVTRSEDILEVFGIKPEDVPSEKEIELANLTEPEKEIMQALSESMPRDELGEVLDLPVHELNSLLSVMEIKGLIKEEFGHIRRL